MRRIGPQLVVASHNSGKIAEIGALLAPFGIIALPVGNFGLAAPQETEESFVGNARIKAHAAARGSGLPALSDDSGLCVAALGGAPGVHTADWAETDSGRDFGLAMVRLHGEIVASGAPQPHRAAFVCTLCLAWPDGEDHIFEGRVDGRVIWPMRGTRGFGFDPVFMPEGHEMTFGEMAPEEKDAMSHRAVAFRKLANACLGG